MTNDVLFIDDDFGDDRRTEASLEETRVLSRVELSEEPETEEPETEEPETEEPERTFEEAQREFRQEAVKLLVDVENTMRRALGDPPIDGEVLVEVAQDGTVTNVYDRDTVDAAHIPSTSTLVPSSEI